MSKELYANKPLQDEYRSHFGNRCEVWQHMPREAKRKCFELGYTKCRQVSIHHIFHNIGRIDEWSNLIAVNRDIHYGWGHGKHLKEFTIVCIYAKWEKSKEEPSRFNPYPSDEFNLEEMRYCFGQDIKGWLNWQMHYEPRLADEYKEMCHTMYEVI